MFRVESDTSEIESVIVKTLAFLPHTHTWRCVGLYCNLEWERALFFLSCTIRVKLVMFRG